MKYSEQIDAWQVNLSSLTFRCVELLSCLSVSQLLRRSGRTFSGSPGRLVAKLAADPEHSTERSINLVRVDLGISRKVRIAKRGPETKREGVDLPQDRRPCFYLSSPMEN